MRAAQRSRFSLTLAGVLVAAAAVVTPALQSGPARAASASASACADVDVAASTRVLARRVLFLGFDKETPKRLEDLSRNGIGGFFVMGSRASKASIPVLKAQLDAIDRGASGRLRPFVGVDEEGGRVQRLKALGTLPSARTLGTRSEASIEQAALDHAEKVRALTNGAGITMDFAPVLDLDDRASGIIADRSFSKDPAAAWRAASAFARGLEKASIVPVYKHFPGHGRASGDSHKVLPSTPPLKELEASDIVPFRSAIAANTAGLAVMMGHLIVPGLTAATTPASWSPEAYRYLRDTLAMTGIVMTDDLNMNALAAEPTVGKRAVRALLAGADMVLVSTTNGAEKVLDEIEAAAAKNPAIRDALLVANRRVRKFGCDRLGVAPA